MAAAEAKLKIYYDAALELVMKCGPLMREGYEKVRNVDITTKTAFYDYVTVYDKQIEDLLINNLKQTFPESQFIGEEEAAISQRDLQLSNAPTWIIDPIDGTTNFINKIPYCCISVGLAIDKELVLGIVFNPILNEMYSAYKGHGAYLNGQRINVSKCTNIRNAVVGYEISLIHRANVRDKNMKRLCKLASNATGTRGLGSAALMLCYVAKGSFHCFHVEDLQPWDIAGGAVIIREAGGFVFNSSGGEFDIMKPNVVAASTNELAQDVVDLIEQANQMTEYTFT